MVVAGTALVLQGGGQALVPSEAGPQQGHELRPARGGGPGEMSLPAGGVGLGHVLLVLQHLVPHEVVDGQQLLHRVPAHHNGQIVVVRIVKRSDHSKLFRSRNSLSLQLPGHPLTPLKFAEMYKS